MGLDSVEILMEVEDAFDIRFEDADAEKLRTPGDLIEAVLGKIGQADAEACLVQRAFNLLRRVLMRHLPLKRRDIIPSARLADLVPKPERRKLMARLATDLGAGALPQLVRPRWLFALLSGLSIAPGIVLAVIWSKSDPTRSWGMALLLGGVMAAVTGFLCAKATVSLRTEFPPLIATVGNFSIWIMAHKKDLSELSPSRWTREQVAARVREIVTEQLGCKGKYREDADLVRDLGID